MVKKFSRGFVGSHGLHASSRGSRPRRPHAESAPARTIMDQAQRASRPIYSPMIFSASLLFFLIFPHVFLNFPVFSFCEKSIYTLELFYLSKIHPNYETGNNTPPIINTGHLTPPLPGCFAVFFAHVDDTSDVMSTLRHVGWNRVI